MADETQTEVKPEDKKAECLDRYKHAFHWVWTEQREWTDKVRCINCGLEKVLITRSVIK
jgi:hypothetical protein